jgi:hypothetical protein
MSKVGDSSERASPAQKTETDAAPAAAPRTLQALAASIGNAEMGRVLASPEARLLLRRALHGSDRSILSRDIEPGEGMEVIKGRDTAKPLGASDRPSSSQFWGTYKSVSYAVFHGEEMKDDVWRFVGGSVGDDFQGGNTCATRVSWAFNNLGWPVRKIPTPASMFKVKFFFNNPKVTFGGKAGDGKWYIVGAPDMESYLRLLWGKPDARLKTNAEATTFEGTLSPGQIAIFAGAHHSGAIMGQDSSAGFTYRDAYVESDPDVMPVSAWTLPP